MIVTSFSLERFTFGSIYYGINILGYQNCYSTYYIFIIYIYFDYWFTLSLLTRLTFEA